MTYFMRESACLFTPSFHEEGRKWNAILMNLNIEGKDRRHNRVIRPNGKATPNYESTYVFTNDFPALLENVQKSSGEQNELFQSAPAYGTCRVMCFSPKSNVSIPIMSVEDIRRVVDEWVKESLELGSKYSWVQIFENKGDVMGCSNPHPHCQIWASDFLPNIPKTINDKFKEYYDKLGRPMLLDYAQQELSKRERIIDENEDWICLVPYWAVWPYEVMILPKERHIRRIDYLTMEERQSLSDAMKRVTIRYDNLFKVSFPYSMGVYGAPFQMHSIDHWQFHLLYYPPLLRSATIKKFMVGYEMFANAQRDLTAEQAAQTLRNLPLLHYSLS
ncbi:galT [Lepeophtheirus salmonis]|uniref:Galactose-1-phosphate uridylyltransferase n=2 Tax=Lepeophtheirus salmonis TaxID=72036 RepID=A0A7R8CLB3_LEPSM|nr:galT [Lepeophtheirus salmonis]CAF2853974.1 galT [Lepeophtheirus salmonis]